MNKKSGEISISILEEEDLHTLVTWAEDEKTMLQWCGPVFEYPLTIEQLKVYFSETQKTVPGRIIHKAIDTNGNIAGMCELGSIDRKNGFASLCRIFTDKNYRGKGIAEMMISEMINYAFNELGLRRLELNVYTFNLPAIRCYEKLGFKQEGLKRKITKYNNEFWDGYFYSLLKEEWKS